MINTADEARKAIDKLNYWTKLYDEGHPQVSDKEWDDLYFELDEYERQTGDIQPQSPTHTISFEVVSTLEKVRHNHFMLSLAKTKDKKDIENFLKNHDWIAMLKMDGLTCSLTYENGKLIAAETRGNGEIGENILHNAWFIKNIPHHIDIHDKLIVDGEIICTYKDFAPFAEEYKNPRNFASGSARLLNSEECKHRNLSFIAWDCIEGLGHFNSLHHKLRDLKNLGFNPVPYIWQMENLPFDLNDVIEQLTTDAKELAYPIDGIVFKYDNCEEYGAAGATSHHFNGGLAYKFYDETYSSRLKYISWTMGRTGQLTPVAIFDPIEIDGTIVEKASLHNVSVMRETLGPHPFIGQKLEVAKRNMIIPQIEWAEDSSQEI